jgi:hypothetical protein
VNRAASFHGQAPAELSHLGDRGPKLAAAAPRSVFGNVRSMVADSLTADAQATALGFISMSWGLGAVLGASTLTLPLACACLQVGGACKPWAASRRSRALACSRGGAPGQACPRPQGATPVL